jgi:hypothetical protein
MPNIRSVTVVVLAFCAAIAVSASSCSDNATNSDASSQSSTAVGGGSLDTAAPTAVATPTTVQATPPVQQAPPPSTVAFVNAPISARPGQATTLIARTSPNTLCTIEVDYKSGPSHAQGLIPKTSDGSGNVSWSWIVGTRTTPGQWQIYVTCGSAANQTYITVV